MRIGVFIGSFNPVHKGHIKVVNDVLSNNYVDKVIIIPTGNYWDKNDLIDIKHRINMLKYYESNKIIILDELNDIPWTYELLRELKKRYKNDTLSLIIGGDNIVSFDKWKNYKELLEYEIIIYKRNNIDINEYLDKLNKKDKVIIINDVKNINISSTNIRKNIQNVEYINKVLDRKVIDYINKNNLYRG